MSCHSPWGFFLQRHKKHPEKASHLCPMQAELGIGDGRPWAPKCGRACAIVGTRPRRGQGSGKAMLPDIHFFLLVSLKWASAAGCTLPLTHPTPTAPTAPIEPTEPASPLSSPIKGRHAPGLTLYALGIGGFISPASLSLFWRPFGSGSHFHFPFLPLYGKI